MRRLPVYLVVDISESMIGENLRQMQEGISRLINQLRRDPYALESVHLSVIAFAGAAGTLSPLTELMNFYPPRLPIGSGTSIGAALNHLMDCLEKNIIYSTPEKKGDWKPLVYIMSDGSPTDDPTQAISRWQQYFHNKAKLINIGIGKFANLDTLNKISDLTYRLDDDDIEKVYGTLCESIADSILSQSRSLGMESPISLNKEILEDGTISLIKNKEQAVALDENYAIIVGKCSKVKLPYLIKYERIEHSPFDNAMFQYVGVYPVEKDYEDWSDHRPNHSKISTSQLWGGGGCPHCGAAFGLCMCNCGQIFCANGEKEVICPGCNETLYFEANSTDFDITRARG